MGCNCKQQNDWKRLLDVYGDNGSNNKSPSNIFLRVLQNILNIIVTLFMVAIGGILFCILLPPLLIYLLICIFTHKEPVIHLDKFFHWLHSRKSIS